MKIDETAIPVRSEKSKPPVKCLGWIRLYVANEGKLIAVVPKEDADRLPGSHGGHPLGKNAAIIGEIVAEHAGNGRHEIPHRRRKRVVTGLSGEQLPRIGEYGVWYPTPNRGGRKTPRRLRLVGRSPHSRGSPPD